MKLLILNAFLVLVNVMLITEKIVEARKTNNKIKKY